ncbi:MAG: Rieske 2Fe-2S domain-containing protein [Chloroflexi bacterium]|nr:Rieske 2Fe-2S domain-containing protein [Chloroflexota bacterium]
MAPAVDTNGSRSPDYRDFQHTGPETLAGRYMRLFWQPVYLARKLETGRAVPIRIMSEDFALYRGEGGTPYCVGLRCAHRGTVLNAGWVEGDCIRCPYHGWKYDGTGQCVEQPLEGEKSGFARKVRIGGYPTREYLGLVYVYFGPGDAPEFPRYPEWEHARMVVPMIDVRPCNYFQNIDNFMDEGHLSFTHRNSAFTKVDFEDLPEMDYRETSWGLTCLARRSGGRVREVQFGMPNMGMFAVHPDNIVKEGEAANTAEVAWQEFLDYRVPIDDETHMQVHAIHVHLPEGAAPPAALRERWAAFEAAEQEAHEVAAKVLRSELSYGDISRLCRHIPLAQDEVVQTGQGVIADHEAEHLGRSDVGIIALRKLWAAELKALSDGRELRHWTRPEGLLPIAGDH